MKKGYKRIQFDFSTDAQKRLEHLQKEIEASTKAEVIRRSLRFYEYIISKMKEGYTLKLIKDNETIIVSSEYKKKGKA